jgi:hypothetical protein
MAGDESWVRRRRQGHHLFIAKKGPKKEENRQVALSGIISYLTAKCGGNVHDRGVIEITASSVYRTAYSRNATDLGDNSYFKSQSLPGQWISFGFKPLRIEPTHYAIQTGSENHLKSWVVEGSGDGVSWTEIDWRENNSNLNDVTAVKMFVVWRSGNFGKIRLRQTSPNHAGNNCLVLSAFELFGEVAGLPDDFVKFCFPMAPIFPFTWAPFNGVISYLTAKCGGNIHDRGVVEITASSIHKNDLEECFARNVANFGDISYFKSQDQPEQWISFDFKTFRIELTHYTIRSA